MWLHDSGGLRMSGLVVVGDSLPSQVTEHHLRERIWTCLLSDCIVIPK